MVRAEGRRITVLMLPFLAHGHVSPYLELSKKLATRNFRVYFCSTPASLAPIKNKIIRSGGGDDDDKSSIELVELHLPSTPELPPHYHTTNGLPPHLMPALRRAFDLSSPNFSKILETLRPDLVIYDFLMPWAPALARSMNIPAVEFFGISAAMFAFTTHLAMTPDAEFPFPSIYLHDYEKDIKTWILSGGNSSADAGGGEIMSDKERATESQRQSCGMILVKTFKDIEDKYINYSSELVGKKIVPVGPLVEEPEPPVAKFHEDEDEEEKEIMRWLDGKERSSTVFVCFGSEISGWSKEDIREIARGLELSEASFLWVLRLPSAGEDDDDKITSSTVEEVLPPGFLDRVVKAGSGKVVSGWAPQGRILRHPSIGGFVNHSGWSSVMESVSCGVPVVALPIRADQPVNCRVAEEVGVVVEVKRDHRGRVQGPELARVIRQVLVDEERDGAQTAIRRRVKEMSEKMRNNGDAEIDEAVREICQLLN